MRRTSSFSLAALTLALFIQPAVASDPIQLARTPAPPAPTQRPPPPDPPPAGKPTPFSSPGDLYPAEPTAGTARALPPPPAPDVPPVFTPDGSKIAFSSNRHGSYDVFVTSVRG